MVVLQYEVISLFTFLIFVWVLQVTLTDCDVNTDKEEDCPHSAVKEDNDPVPVQPTNEVSKPS